MQSRQAEKRECFCVSSGGCRRLGCSRSIQEGGEGRKGVVKAAEDEGIVLRIKENRTCRGGGRWEVKR